MEVEHWERKNSNMALCEVNQEFVFQRFQIQHTNRWAYLAQRDQIKLAWRNGNEDSSDKIKQKIGKKLKN